MAAVNRPTPRCLSAILRDICPRPSQVTRSSKPVIVTGAAGFIGHSVAHRLLDRGERVIGVDIVNDYYDPALKEARLATFKDKQAFSFERMDIADAPGMAALIRDNRVTRVVHLAAQAGVRYSL